MRLNEESIDHDSGAGGERNPRRPFQPLPAMHSLGNILLGHNERLIRTPEQIGNDEINATQE